LKISVTIIAHNEAATIGRCLQAVLAQDLKSDEIILIAHNCTDATIDIAKNFAGVTVIPFNAPAGIGYARAEAFRQASGEIVACLDGDSYPAARSWLRNITAPLSDPSVSGVAGFGLFFGNPYAFLMSLNFFFLKRLIDPTHWIYFWGFNFACRKDDYEKIGGLAPLIANKAKWALTYWADDYYLSKQLNRLGRIAFVPSAIVLAKAKPLPVGEWSSRSRAQGEDKIKIDAAIGVQ